MEPLRTGDPSRIGRYRLLRRLGAGGMGVVFLARAPGGAIAAVKTVRSSYADESGFRARFRREVEAARQVSSPWVVPLLDADADAETPWLATSYVPGPSLAETVDAFGPLSLASVRVLGLRLAEALEAVHGAGLVHRDVKPGNVLLAPDGPRLIDFGIARAPEATALTSSGVIVGSPGFLSPEQARARGGEIGPPSDVFSLACVLAFAATGVRPFGDGGAAGVLLRTIYEEPDPAALPDGLAPLLRCLPAQGSGRPPEPRAPPSGTRGRAPAPARPAGGLAARAGHPADQRPVRRRAHPRRRRADPGVRAGEHGVPGRRDDDSRQAAPPVAPGSAVAASCASDPRPGSWRPVAAEPGGGAPAAARRRRRP